MLTMRKMVSNPLTKAPGELMAGRQPVLEPAKTMIGQLPVGEELFCFSNNRIPNARAEVACNVLESRKSDLRRAADRSYFAELPAEDGRNQLGVIACRTPATAEEPAPEPAGRANILLHGCPLSSKWATHAADGDINLNRTG